MSRMERESEANGHKTLGHRNRATWLGFGSSKAQSALIHVHISTTRDPRLHILDRYRFHKIAVAEVILIGSHEMEWNEIDFKVQKGLSD